MHQVFLQQNWVSVSPDLWFCHEVSEEETYMYIYLNTVLCVFPSWKPPSLSEPVSPAAGALRRTVASPKHGIFNSQNTTSTAPNQSRNNLLTAPRESITHRQTLSKEQGMNIWTASIFPPNFVSKGFCWAPPGESQAASGPAVSPGEAPDKDLATPIPTEQRGGQRLPALQTCAIQHLPRREQRAWGSTFRGTTKGLQNSSGVRSQHLATSCLTCMGAPHSLRMGTDPQDPGSAGFAMNSRHSRGLSRSQGLHHPHRPARTGRNRRHGLALKALLPFIN